MTKRAMFTALTAIVIASTCDQKDELLTALAHEVELLDKKASAPKKPTAVQVANIELRAKVTDILSDTPKTVSDILAELGDATVTNQRVTHILTAMVTDGEAVRGIIKRKAYYTAC